VHRKEKIEVIQHLASIDLGSYTARLLVARIDGGKAIEPIVRKRIYIRLAEDSSFLGSGILGKEAQARALEALRELYEKALVFAPSAVRGVATGVIRRAKNRRQFLAKIKKETGIDLELITGEQEAILSAKGALSAVKGIGSALVIFDLGGGSTEFFFRQRSGKGQRVLSIALGAAELTKRFIRSDPPEASELAELNMAIEKILEDSILDFNSAQESPSVVGTGGTVTSLAAMIHEVPVSDISHENLNGTKISSSQIERIFDRMIQFPRTQRASLPGLDNDRAEVIIAGTLCVLAIMRHLGVQYLYVSLSDLLEGLLIEYLENSKANKESNAWTDMNLKRV